MSDLTAQLTLRFGVAPPPVTFILEASQDDARLNKPIQVEPAAIFNWYWTEAEFAAFYDGKEILKVLENGQQHLRLYAPDDFDTELVATQLPVAINARYLTRLSPQMGVRPDIVSEFTRKALRFEDVSKFPGVSVTQAAPARPAPPSIEYIGRFEAVVVDEIEFQNSRVGFMKYNYVTRGFETIYCDSFVTDDGRRIAPPVWMPEFRGAFVLSEPATGVVVISYPASYRLYKMNYGMSVGVEFPKVQIAWLRGDITQCAMPHVTVIAVARGAGRVARASVERDVYPRGASLATWSMKGFGEAMQGLPNLFVEAGRVTENVDVHDPENPDNFITVQKARQVVGVDEKGRKFTFKFNG